MEGKNAGLDGRDLTLDPVMQDRIDCDMTLFEGGLVRNGDFWRMPRLHCSVRWSPLQEFYIHNDMADPLIRHLLILVGKSGWRIMKEKPTTAPQNGVANIGNGEIPVSARVMAADFLDPVAGVLGRGIRRDKGTELTTSIRGIDGSPRIHTLVLPTRLELRLQTVVSQRRMPKDQEKESESLKAGDIVGPYIGAS